MTKNRPRARNGRIRACTYCGAPLHARDTHASDERFHVVGATEWKCGKCGEVFIYVGEKLLDIRSFLPDVKPSVAKSIDPAMTRWALQAVETIKQSSGSRYSQIRAMTSLRDALEFAHWENMNVEELQAVLQRHAPQLSGLSKFAPKNATELQGYVMVLIAVLTVLIAFFSDDDKTVTNIQEQVINHVTSESSGPMTAPAQPPKAAKPKRKLPPLDL